MPTVAVLSMKGGVGKTTVVLGLASAAWQQDRRTLVVDLDPQANATMALDVDAPEFTASDVMADARPGVAAAAITSSGWSSAVDVLPSERGLEHRARMSDAYSNQRLRTSLATVPRRYDLVLIDCPPSLGELTRNALAAADVAVVVTEPNHFAVHGAAEACAAVEAVAASANPRLRTAAIVVNRVRPDDPEHALHRRLLVEAHGETVYAQPVPDCPALATAQRSGAPIHAWSAPGSTAVAEVFDDLLDSLAPRRAPEPRVSIRRFLS